MKASERINPNDFALEEKSHKAKIELVKSGQLQLSKPADIMNLKLAEMVSDVDLEGDFAFYVSQGRMIENGKLTAPIKDVNIMGNGPKMLENVTMVANDLKLYEGGTGTCGKDGQGVPVSFGLPTCLVKSMTIGGVQQQGA